MNGVIYFCQGEGVFVKNIIIINGILEFMELVFLEDIVEVRMYIEFLIIKFVVLRVIDEDIQELKQMIEKMEEEMFFGVYVFEIDE